MKSYKFKINNNSFTVDIKSVEDNFINMEVNGTPFKIEMEKTVQTTKTPTLVRANPVSPNAQATPVKSTGVKKVEAPLPGVILTIAVKEGDTVKMGDTILVMEAMKMENSIHAETSGVIKSIKVKPQDSVLQGDVLVEIE